MDHFTSTDATSVDSFDQGINVRALESYIQKLDEKYYEAIDLINNVTEINEAINRGWSGKRKDEFLNNLDIAVSRISAVISKEYQYLSGSLMNLKAKYIKLDEDGEGMI